MREIALNGRKQRTLTQPLILIIGLGVGGIGVAGLIGWITGIRFLIQTDPSLPALHYVSATAFLLIGFGFILRSFDRSIAAVFCVMSAAALVLISTAANELLQGPDVIVQAYALFGFDVFFVPDVGIAPNTGLAIMLTGFGFVFATWLHSRITPVVVSVIGASVFALGSAAAIGYISNISPLYDWAGYYGMSAYAAVALIFVGGGMQVLAIEESPSSGWFINHRWIVVPVFVGIEVAVASLSIAVRTQADLVIHEAIDAHSLAIQIGMAEKLRSDLQAIRRLAARWNAEDANAEKAWEADATAYLADIPEFVALGWADESLISRWLVPPSARQAVLGKDLGFEPIRRAAIDAARLTREPRITQTVELLIGGLGVVVFVPIFKDDNFHGFINAAYQPDALFETVAKEALEKEFSIKAYDQNLLVFERTFDEGDTEEKWGIDRNLESYGANWRIRIWPTKDYLERNRGSLPTQIFVGGTLINALIITLILLSQNAYSARLIVEKTSAMLEAKNTELSLAKKASDSANLAKSTFLSNMSHEIRTPLGAMIGYVDLLRRSNSLSAENGKYLDIIARNGRTLLSLINDILDLAKVESGNLICERSSMRLPDVILDVLSTLRFSASEKGLALTAAFTSRVPVEIESDYIRLRQLLMNLVGNAIKFTTKGSVFVGIRLIPGNVGAQIEVEVVDTGCGIATDDQRRLFEPFTQGDPTVSRRFGGTGLGLSLSRKLARTLGGDVYLKQSVVGEGSVFVATIDAGRFNAEAMIHPAEIDLLKSTSQERSIFQLRRSPHGIKALVVDDSPDMLLLTGTILRSAGVVVGEAMNGRDGVEKALNGEFDVLFMDVQMPILNGEEAVRELRSLGFSKPIIALTANAMVGERERVIALGFSDYLSKPVAPDRLLDAIERHTILKSSTISVETVVANDCVDRIKT